MPTDIPMTYQPGELYPAAPVYPHMASYVNPIPQPSQTQSILDRLAALERAVGIGPLSMFVTSGALVSQPATDQHYEAK